MMSSLFPTELSPRSTFGTHSRIHAQRAGFSLIEVAVVLAIVAILLTLAAGPISSQLQQARTTETKRMMEEAKEALIGFAIANGRFPCPAIEGAAGTPDNPPNSAGLESFCVAAAGSCPGAETTTPQPHGNCSNFYGGFLPAASLGLAGIDDKGFLRDAWVERANRIRYAVSDQTVGTELLPFTRPGGMKAATIDGLGEATKKYVFVCSAAAGMTASACGPGNELTARTPVILFSRGANASAPAVGSDEQKNLDGDKVFIWHTPSSDAGNEFDDIFTWIPITSLLSRLQAAGKMQ